MNIVFWIGVLVGPFIWVAVIVALLWPIDRLQRWHWRRTLRPVRELGRDWFWKDGHKRYIPSK